MARRDKPLWTNPGPTESELHLSVANLLDWVLLPPALYTTFPAGWGVLSPSLGQKLRRSGLKPGMPDMMVFYNGRCFGIELKARKNGLSDEQKAMFPKLADAGVPVYVCRSIEAVWEVLVSHDVPLRKVRGDDRWSLGTKRLPLDETFGRRAGGGEAGGIDGRESRETG